MSNKNSKCSICGASPTVARGWCNKHYRRWQHHGDPNFTKYVKSSHVPGTLEHLLENVEWVDGPLETQCRVWTKAFSAAGYGVVGTSPQVSYAHRVAFELHSGKPIPEGQYVCHRCDNPPCTNIEHLFLGLPIHNSTDMIDKGRDRKFRKLSTDQVILIRADTRKNTEIAAEYGVSDSAVSKIKKRDRRSND